MARTKRPTLAEIKKMKLVNLIRDVQSSGSGPEDSWNPAEISERLKDINYIRRMVDSWNPAELNHALQLLGFKTIDSWNPAIIEEMRTSLIRIFQERTATGNPIELNLPGNLPYEIKSLKLIMNPIQDLHGYDSPWAGGSGKNKFQTTATSETVNGTVFTVNTDGSISIKNTPSANISNYNFGIFTLKAGVYKANGFSGGASNNIRFNVRDNNSSTVFATIYGGNDVEFTLSEDTEIRIYPIVPTSFDGNEVTMYPMIRLSTVTDATFAPYSNICPISGRDSADVVISDGETEQTKTITFPNTVYGGTDEIVSGTGISDMGIIDIGDANWSYSDSVFSIAKADIGMKTGTTDVSFISDIYPRGGSGQDGVMYQTSSFLLIRDSNYTDLETFKTAMSGHQICFSLNEPTEFSTTPVTDLELNNGTNIISTDADDIELKYQINLS